MTRSGKASARKLNRAHILLAADDGDKDEDIARRVRVSTGTVAHVRQRFAEEGLESALNERVRPGRKPLLEGRQEAHLIALACSQAPEGRTKWTLRLLADQLVELNIVDEVSHQTVWRALKRGRSSPGNASSGASPASARNSLRPWRTSSSCSPSRTTLSGR
jgi:transposase